MIQVSELHFSTEDGVKILEDVHLHVEQGELLYLVGAAASGKSLLLGLLAAQTPPQRGQILVHGRNVVRLGPEKVLELRRRIGFLPQGYLPLARTVHDNVVFKLRALGDYREQAEEKAMLALETTGLLRQQQLDAQELSSMDRIRLGISIALCHDPLLLLLDEPFEGLTEEEAEEIGNLLHRLHNGHLTMIVASRGPLPRIAHEARRIELVDGGVRAR